MDGWRVEVLDGRWGGGDWVGWVEWSDYVYEMDEGEDWESWGWRRSGLGVWMDEGFERRRVRRVVGWNVGGWRTGVPFRDLKSPHVRHHSGLGMGILRLRARAEGGPGRLVKRLFRFPNSLGTEPGVRILCAQRGPDWPLRLRPPPASY